MATNKRHHVTESEEGFFECVKCGITSYTKDRMIPCPRGGCEAEETGVIVTNKRLILKEGRDNYEERFIYGRSVFNSLNMGNGKYTQAEVDRLVAMLRQAFSTHSAMQQGQGKLPHYMIQAGKDEIRCIVEDIGVALNAWESTLFPVPDLDFSDIIKTMNGDSIDS